MSLDLCFKQLHVIHIKGFLVLVRHFPVLQIPVTRTTATRYSLVHRGLSLTDCRGYLIPSRQ